MITLFGNVASGTALFTKHDS